MEHVQTRGIDLFTAAREHDLEGVVGKWLPGRLFGGRVDGVVGEGENPAYGQIEGRP